MTSAPCPGAMEPNVMKPKLSLAAAATFGFLALSAPAHAADVIRALAPTWPGFAPCWWPPTSATSRNSA